MKIAIVGRLLGDRHDALVAAITAKTAEQGTPEIVTFEDVDDRALANHPTHYGLIIIGDTHKTTLDITRCARLLNMFSDHGAIIVRDVNDRSASIFGDKITYVSGSQYDKLLIEVEAAADQDNQPVSSVNCQISGLPYNDGF